MPRYILHACSQCGSTVETSDARSAIHYIMTLDLTCCPGDTFLPITDSLTKGN